MAQVKIYGFEDQLLPVRQELSDVIHDAVKEALAYPEDKRFHRFIPLSEGSFFYGPGRSRRYTIIEVSLFEGRTLSAKKLLVRRLFELTEARLGLSPDDLEITLFETPRENWGIRGMHGDEMTLGYKVDV